jgi:DNA-directed RNA polymerase specialized sigma24 family protein
MQHLRSAEHVEQARQIVAELYQTYRAQLVGFNFRSLRDEQEADDLAHATFVKFFEYLLKEAASSSARMPRSQHVKYLFGIARNEIRQVFRKRKSQPEQYPEHYEAKTGATIPFDYCRDPGANGERMAQFWKVVFQMPEFFEERLKSRRNLVTALRTEAARLGAEEPWEQFQFIHDYLWSENWDDADGPRKRVTDGLQKSLGITSGALYAALTHLRSDWSAARERAWGSKQRFAGGTRRAS